MAPKELHILRLLMDNPRGLYGSEMVHISDGKLSRGTVYTLLERLIDKGFVREETEPASPGFNAPRTRHFITGEGQRACHEFAKTLGLQIIAGALAR
jgi:DNA-binding PadR family transcriptional regulator